MAGKTPDKPHRKMKRSKDKTVKTVQLQNEDGTPIDEDPEQSEWRMNKRQAKGYKKVVGRMMKEQGMTENEAFNEMLRVGINKEEHDVASGLSTVRTSRQHELGMMNRSLITGLGLDVVGGSAFEMPAKEYADPEKAHLLEPGAEALLETEIYRTMARNDIDYKEARERLLTNGDNILDERDYAKLIRAYENEQKGEIDDEQMAILKDLYRKTKKKNTALARSEPWFKRLNQIKKLNPSARSLLRWIGMLNNLPKWSAANEDDTSWEESDEKVQKWHLDLATRSRIFDVDPVQVGTLVANIIEHMQRILSIEEHRDFTEEESKALMIQTQAMGFPPNLPYPYTFVGFGIGFTVSDKFFQGDGSDLRLLGLFYSDRGHIELLFSWENTHNRFKHIPKINTHEIYSQESEWSVEHAIPELQWMAVALIDTINAHRTIVLEGPPLPNKENRQLKKLTRTLDLQLMPSAFYTAELRSKVYLHAIRRLAPVVAHRRAMSYRTDRRAHERCKIRRGPLPHTARERLDHEHLKKDLLKRGYALYEYEEPSGIDDERLYTRGLKRKHEGEWIAILAYPVRKTIVGPPEAPYVPRVDVIKTLDPTDIQS